ncbi:hypothetical protein AB0D37_44180 [Streptomyces sp. NPDC048384]|uniref:hypothetical protein n=1 Tax=Streptomyces sp. NPDC048384 TaxID=3155487 RepID=UPI0034209AF3
MKKLTTRSATLAACTALLIAATVGQASADAADDEPTPSRIVVVKGGNNNVAGNDLHVGNNNTSGTGHSIGEPRGGIGDPQSTAQTTVNVYNCSGSTFTLTNLANNPRTNGEWLSPQATPPATIPSHPATLDGNQCLAYGASANWTSAGPDRQVTSTALYDIPDGGSIEFDAIVDWFLVQVGADCPRIGTDFTCAWLTSINNDTTSGTVSGVVNFIVVPGA